MDGPCPPRSGCGSCWTSATPAACAAASWWASRSVRSRSTAEAIILFDNEDPIGVRTQAWKYVESAYYRGLKLPMTLLGYEQLYDVKADPSENYSVAATHPEIAKAMRERLAAAKAEFAPFKHKDIPPVFKALRAQLEHLQD